MIEAADMIFVMSAITEISCASGSGRRWALGLLSCWEYLMFMSVISRSWWSCCGIGCRRFSNEGCAMLKTLTAILFLISTPALALDPAYLGVRAPNAASCRADDRTAFRITPKGISRAVA